MVALSPQTSRYNPRAFLYFFAGSLTVILIYVLAGHLPSRESAAAFQAPHSDSIAEDNSHNTASNAPAETEHQDGWYTSPEENPYGEEGVDVSELITPEQLAASNENMKIEHVELRSQMTKDGKWFTTDFVTQEAYNPGFLPHPYKSDTWVMFAQRDKSKDGDDIWNSELSCEATYHEASQSMKCTEPPNTLPIASTFSDLCGVSPYELLYST